MTPSSPRGTADVLADLVTELRSDSPLVGQLPAAEAIYQGHPTQDRGYKAAVVLWPVYEGSTRHRGALTRRYRVQVTVKTAQPWREARDAEAGTTGLTAMHEILDAVAHALDDAAGLAEIPEGAESGVGPRAMDNGWLAISGDWIVQGHYGTSPEGR